MKGNHGNLYGYSPEEYQRFSRYAFRYLILFSMLYCTLYCARLNLPNVSYLMMSELKLSKTDIGVLTSVLFWTYAFGQLINGRMCDKLNPAFFIIVSVTVSIAANFLVSLQTRLVIIAVIWGINGFVQSMAWAPGIKIITRWWPESKHGFATGFALAFSGFGQAAATLSVALAITVLPQFGWRSAFILPAVFPLLMFIIYLLFAKTAPVKVGLKDYRDDSETTSEALPEGRGFFGAYKRVISDQHFLSWFAIIFCAGIVRYGLITWIPLYFIDRYNVDVTDGLIRSLALPLGMGLGTIVVPWLTDSLCPGNRLAAVVASAGLVTLTVLPLIFLDPTVGWQLVCIEALLFVSGFCVFAVSGSSGAYAADIGGRAYSGTATGLLSFSAYMGAAIQSLIFGFILDAKGWTLVFIAISLQCLFIMLIAVRDLRSAQQEHGKRPLKDLVTPNDEEDTAEEENDSDDDEPPKAGNLNMSASKKKLARLEKEKHQIE